MHRNKKFGEQIHFNTINSTRERKSDSTLLSKVKKKKKKACYLWYWFPDIKNHCLIFGREYRYLATRGPAHSLRSTHFYWDLVYTQKMYRISSKRWPRGVVSKWGPIITLIGSPHTKKRCALACLGIILLLILFKELSWKPVRARGFVT